MNFPLYVARRYLFSKKSTNAINVISVISVIGVAVATMALVIVLSVFNGFHDLVATFFTNFDPQLEVVPTQGKTAPSDDPLLAKMKALPEVDVATESVEDQALAIYQDHQAMVIVKGVDDNFDQLTHIKDILFGDGTYSLHAGNLQYGIMGIRLAAALGTGARFGDYLRIYAPQKEGQFDATNPSEAFVVDSLLSPGVVFSVNQSKYDKNYIIAPIAFARNLFGQQGRLSSLEFRLKDGSDLDAVKKEMQEIGGAKYKVMDRFEQQADTFKIMQIEKYIAYIFLTFILIVACFNIIGSLSMLIIDKKEDVVTLRNLGANDRQISQIFLFEGRLISAFGAIIGIGLGLLLCWLQQQYGLVSLGSSSGSFVINAYPVSVHYDDVALIFLTVIVVGWVAVWYPVKRSLTPNPSPRRGE
ncbi:efflux ABC transporter, permease protein [Segatella oris F0302]|uniref:Efflux ABC transporter, permease protein n=1 Tax=Segatella oris F0302 TaxID=649760 RepID=D1QVH1_9BACT|nr:FtsX-like permease family protein [Segatella oris]EFB30692.1 efflux ABC transporter, permease protein [Segatella oris F0302]